MACSDEEGETLPDVVSDYYFCGAEDEPLSFTELPVQWGKSESSQDNKSQIFLRGTTDNGLQKLYKQVKAWKYDFLKAKPEISVLSKDNNWIKLQKPRKSFENEIRTILITVHCLHFFKRKPEASGKALWDHLCKVFSLYDIRPSENDLIDHLNFISEAVKRDKTLAKSKFLASFLEEKPRKRKAFDEKAEAAMKPSFIIDDMNDEYGDEDLTTKEAEDSESDDEEDGFDSVCAICDNGGDLTCCEGKCLRSFHATVESADPNCESLGLTAEEVEGSQRFLCLNCCHKQHQCFVCGELGSSDKSSVAEVFCCSSATCGRFYHPRCVAKLLAEAQDLQEKIAAGEPFTCPSHKCHKCKLAENEKVEGLRFAICRRCPRSYHRKCLPSEIVFCNEDNDEDVIARAWDKLLPKSRALLYCLKHKIDEELGTPVRNLKFPEIGHSKKQPVELLLSKKKVAVNEEVVNSDYTSEKTSFSKSHNRVEKSSSVRPVDSSRKRVKMSFGPESLKKQRVTDTSKKLLKRTLSMKVNRPSVDDNQPSLGSRLYEYMINGNETSNSKKNQTSVDEDEQTSTATPLGMENGSLPSLDADSEERILALMKDATSSITLEKVKRHHIGKLPSTHASLSKVDKSIILARVEGLVEAVHLALKKLEEGCSLEDAMAVCEPCVLDQLMRWKDKLKVYLAPFLHGMRYTSFGRHFTKVEKLEKIVDRLHWYVEDGDMIVDFCCGANDFSCLMKKRLEEMGKRCSYKNYDISRPKNDFYFEKRDWMTVLPKELLRGSQLIMGLNPPFGKNASLANRFIDQALRFKPKLVILIVPPETKRLDHEKIRTPYDLVWEDAKLLAGKSFYLPGSVDINDKQMDQWNNTPPPLYLWSRQDWTSKHIAVAQQHGHISKVQEVLLSDENVQALDLPVENHELYGEVPMLHDNFPVTEKDTDQTTEKAAASVRSWKESSRRDNDGTGTKEKLVGGEKRSIENLKKKHGNDVLGVEGRKEKHSLSFPCQSQAPETSHSDLSQGRKEKHFLPPPHQSRASDTPRSDIDFGGKEKHSSPLPSQSQALETLHSDMSQGRKEKHSLSLPHQSRASETLRSDIDFGGKEKHKEKHSSPLPSQSQALETLHSDMSVGRKEKHSSPRPHQSRASETPHSDIDFGKGAGKPFSQAMYKSYSHYDIPTGGPYVGAAYGQPDSSPLPHQSRASETPRSDIDFGKDAGKPFSQAMYKPYSHYNIATRDPYVGAAYGLPDGTSVVTPDYRIRRLDTVQSPGYERENIDSHSYSREAYIEEIAKYGIDSSLSQRSGYHHEPGFSTGYGPGDPLSYNRVNTSAMQRYAPRLDELNHTRTNNMGPELPLLNRGKGVYDHPLPGPRLRMDYSGFAPGPYLPFPQHNSSGGWLNE